jgi:hypothetical protein
MKKYTPIVTLLGTGTRELSYKMPPRQSIGPDSLWGYAVKAQPFFNPKIHISF